MTGLRHAPLAYYGKLPARGDFVGQRLPRATTSHWDDWQQRSIVASREALGPTWLDQYLVAPIWRFALAPGICGSAALAGVWVPSVDAVGRSFPLMLAVELPGSPSLAAVLEGERSWFDTVEEIALSALRDDFAIERLDQPIPALDAGPSTAAAVCARPALASPGVCLPLSDVAEAGGAYGAWLGEQSAAGTRHSLWWTVGSERVGAVLVIAADLPPPEAFAPFIDGGWASAGWSVLGQPCAPSLPPEDRASWDRED